MKNVGATFVISGAFAPIVSILPQLLCQWPLETNDQGHVVCWGGQAILLSLLYNCSAPVSLFKYLARTLWPGPMDPTVDTLFSQAGEYGHAGTEYTLNTV